MQKENIVCGREDKALNFHLISVNCSDNDYEIIGVKVQDSGIKYLASISWSLNSRPLNIGCVGEGEFYQY